MEKSNLTAVEQLGVAFRQWQRDWDNFKEKDKPISFDEFIKPFLEIEKQQFIDAYLKGSDYIFPGKQEAEQYYNEKYNK